MRFRGRHILRAIGAIRLLAAALALPLLLAAAPASRAGGALAWPLGVPGTLLSSFGEYRYDHLHGGIDISTGGQTGHKVLAAAAGAVFRLKVEWRGYGRAIYVRHPGGRVTVYGHLERFEDTRLHLERRVARRQAEMKTRYPGDIHLDPPLPVRRGQVIGYSGESGVGLPHLHFEVRGPGDVPVDPFASGLRRLPDRRSPVLAELIITAATEESFVDGVRREKSYALARRGGVYASDEPVRVSGPFLAALVAHDPAGAEGRAGVRSIRMAIDGSARYRLALRAVRFDQYPQAGLIYDHRASRLGPPRYAYRLVRLPGNELAEAPGEESNPPPPEACPGAVDLPAGAHQMEIAVEDAAGNMSRARVCLLAGGAASPPILADGKDVEGRGSIRFALGVGEQANEPPRKGLGGNACAAPARTVQGDLWAGEGEEFRPLDCDAETGRCVPRWPHAGRGFSAVRLRQVLHGVPGPWRVAPLGEDGDRVSKPGEARLEAWPGFIDVLVSVPSPLVPDLAIVTWPRAEPVTPLVYRDGLLAGAGIGYRRAFAAGPLAVAAGPRVRGSAPHPLPEVRFFGPGEGQTYGGPGFTIEVPAGGRFYPGPLAVRSVPVAGSPALPAVGDAIDLLPEGEALNERATLRFDLSGALPDPSALGIYRWDPFRQGWSYEGGELDPGGRTLSMRFRRYGRFALLQDASPPVIMEVWPPDGARGAGRRPRLWARIEEEGEGIDHDGVAFVLDGAPLEAEFDPDRGRARVLDPPALAAGAHRIRVTATDRAGNSSGTIETSFEVR
ncbi:MAG: M23 family metallopeptidase [Acidobacteria bacterium]|nr:M23 family metallopeptidase [Acidobacteriota bacterium]